MLQRIVRARSEGEGCSGPGREEEGEAWQALRQAWEQVVQPGLEEVAHRWSGLPFLCELQQFALPRS